MSEEEIPLTRGTNLILGKISSSYIVIALGLMTVFCLILLAKMISQKRAYSILAEEVKERKNEPASNGDSTKITKSNTCREIELL